MHHLKLIALYQALTPGEWHQLQDFMASPFHIKNKTAKRLFLLLSEHYPEFNSDSLQKEKLYFSLFPEKKKYDDLKMRLLMNMLYAAGLEFLYALNTAATPHARALETLAQLRRKGLSRQYQSLLQKTGARFAEQAPHSADHYYQVFRLEEEQNLFLESQHKRDEEPHLQLMSDALDHYYFIQKLKIYCKAISYGSMVNVNYDIRLIRQVWEVLSAGQYAGSPLLSLYHHTSLALTDTEDESHFRRLQQDMAQYFEHISTGEQANILAFAKNYCIRKLNSGKAGFINDLFGLYEMEFLDNDHYTTPGSLPAPTYSNVVTVGIRLHKMDWVKDFIERYKDCLPTNRAESIYAYNKARWLFAMKEFGKVIKMLAPVESDDIFVQIEIKLLLLKTYYERGNWMSMESLLQSLSSFIRRKTILSYHKKNYLNFLHYLRRLSRTDNSDKSKRRELHEAISQEKQITEKEWLMAKTLARNTSS